MEEILKTLMERMRKGGIKNIQIYLDGYSRAKVENSNGEEVTVSLSDQNDTLLVERTAKAIEYLSRK